MRLGWFVELAMYGIAFWFVVLFLIAAAREIAR